MINLFFLLLMGKYLAHLYLSLSSIFVLLLFTMAVEHLCLYIKNKGDVYFSFSSLSTVIGVMLMMVSVQLWVYMCVIVMGILQKHILSIEGRHFFNPSNFALLMALLLFYDKAHIVLGQLGDDSWMICVVVVLAGMILWRVDRWVIPLVFCLAYFTFEYYFIIRYDPVMIAEDVVDRFLSISFIVFIVFMLTDPKTTPKKREYQIVFAVCIALGASFLDVLQGFRVQHLFFSLAFFSPWVVILSLWEQGNNQRRLIAISSLIIVFIVSAIIFIEMKPPYYFSMDG